MYDDSTLLPSEARQIISERVSRAADARTARSARSCPSSTTVGTRRPIFRRWSTTVRYVMRQTHVASAHSPR